MDFELLFKFLLKKSPNNDKLQFKLYKVSSYKDL